ncbi:MAG: NUDIX hydrolase, partial [Rhodospirillaceae bacterium]
EAHLDPALARRATPAGLVSYAFDAPEGLRADTLFCYDLEVPEDVAPQPSEEITRFDLMPIKDVLALVRDTDTFKFNVGLVILDFAMRHGLIGPETEADYDAIACGLRERPQPLV